MATNVEKFVVDLGFNDSDLKKLKELLKLQQTADNNAPKRAKTAKQQAREQLASSKAIDKLGQSTRKTHENILKAQEKQTQELKKQEAIAAKLRKVTVKDTGQRKDSQARFKGALSRIDGTHKQADSLSAMNEYYSKLEEMQQRRGKNLAQENEFYRKLGILSGNDPELKASREAMRNHYKQVEKEALKAANNVSKKKPSSPVDDILFQEEFGRKFANRIRGAGGEASSQRKYAEQAIEVLKLKKVSTERYQAALLKLNNDVNDYIRLQRQATMRTRKHNIAMQGLNDSTRHMIRSYASLYAVFEATSAINRTGQQFEAMNSAMLAATGTSEMAANEVAFLDKMTSRLGLSLLDTSDAYTKFLFASKGKLDQDQTRELFTGLSELGTTLGVSKERMKLSMNAITQMMNKGKISSEELRLI